MHPRPENPTLEVALAAAAMQYVPVPCAPGTKVPCVPWKEWQTRMPPVELIREWFADRRRNIAILTTGLVVFDCDEVALAELVLKECGDTPHKLRTPRGGLHLGYRRRAGVTLTNRVRVRGMPIDIRTDGGLEVIPDSATADGLYRWVGRGLRPASELPVARIGWTRERVRRVVRPIESIGDATHAVRAARAYVAHIEGAVSGQRGHDKTFRVACVLARKFGLSFAQAWPLILEWNEQCEPPWTERELEHKLRDALDRR